MNKSKIEWCDHTWNPITGCRHDCSYCYARAMTSRFSGDVRLNLMAKKDYQIIYIKGGIEKIYVLEKAMINETGKPLVYPFGFEPTYHKYRLDTLDKLKMGKNIFVGAMADIFGDWIPDEWISDIFSACKEYPQHNYMFLTKNPERYLDLYSKGKLPYEDNFFYGATATQGTQLERATKVFTDLPVKFHTFFSIEPILDDIGAKEIWNEAIIQTDWVIIGAEAGKRSGKVTPQKKWIDSITESCEKYAVPIFMKDSLIHIVGEENMHRDFPPKLKHKEISPKMKKKLYSNCSGCEIQLKKSDMITLLARSKRGERPVQFGFMCKDCYEKLCSILGVNIPKLDGLKKGDNTDGTMEL